MRMRKRIILLLTFVLALTVSIAVFAGCSGCGKVTVEISRETLEVVTGRTGTLTATASNGAEIEWSSSDEAVATVSGGKVTGVKAGKATITASAAKGKGSATCEVTVKDPVIITFKNEEGNVITEADVDREGTLQLTATASDGSTVTQWTSSNERVATVSSSGLVSGLFDGEVTITVNTSTGAGEINVKVVDRFEGKKYTITDGGDAGEWWYQFNGRDNREHEVYIAEYRGGVVTFEFGGNVNWTNGDVKLNLKKDDTAKEGWTAVTGKINSSVEGKVTIFDTEVEIREGDNNFEVYFNQAAYAEAFMFSPNNVIAEGKFVITELNWEDYTLQNLEIPSFTVNGDTVTITDTVNEKGVKSYSIGFFKTETDGAPAYVQTFAKGGGDIDPAVGETGDYYLRIKVEGISGFIGTGWSTEYVQYHLDASKAVYELERTTTPSSTRWVYYNVTEDYATTDEASFNAGVVTYKAGYLGWKFDSTQMYRHYAQFEAGVELELTMKIYCNVSGAILISGQKVNLVAGETVDRMVYITQPANGATITILFGDPAVENVNNWGEYDETGIEFTFEVVSIGTYVPRTLETPSANFVAATDSASAKMQIVDNGNAPVTVKKYVLGFFDETDKLVRTLTLSSEDWSFSDKSITDGTYTLKVRALSAVKGYYDSEWSQAITDYEVANGGISYELVDEARSEPQDDGIWWYWADPEGWTGAWVTVSEATYANDALTISFESAGTSDYGLQIKYNNPDYVNGYIYKLDLLADADMDVQVESGNAIVTHLKAGEKETVYGGQDASFYLQVNIKDGVGGTLTLSNIVWEELVPITLEAPSISVDGSGVVTISDSNAKGVAGYTVSFYKDDMLVATVPVVNGEPLDFSRFAAGEYTLKVMAKATALPYYDSALSTGITYNIVKEGGVKYDLGMDDPGSGAWYYWAAINPDWSEWSTWVTEVKTAEYDNGTVTVAVTTDSTEAEKACPWGIQLKYTAPQAINGTFKVTATADCTINYGNEKYNLTAGVEQELTFSGTDFYLQVNIKGKMDLSLTLTDMSWES